MDQKQIDLDDIDEGILRVLNDDGRASLELIAERFDITPDEVERRIESMRDAGVITGFTVLLNPTVLGYISVAFGLTAEPGKTDDIAAELAGYDNVYKLWILSGRHNVIAHACFEDISEFQEFTHETLNNIEGIAAYESSIATRSVIDRGSVIL